MGFSLRTFKSNWKEFVAWGTIIAMLAVIGLSNENIVLKLGVFVVFYTLFLFPFIFFDKESFSEAGGKRLEAGG